MRGAVLRPLLLRRLLASALLLGLFGLFTAALAGGLGAAGGSDAAATAAAAAAVAGLHGAQRAAAALADGLALLAVPLLHVIVGVTAFLSGADKDGRCAPPRRFDPVFPMFPSGPCSFPHPPPPAALVASDRLYHCYAALWYSSRWASPPEDRFAHNPLPDMENHGAMYPAVCVQLPMFNERACAADVIAAACSLAWPADRFLVQARGMWRCGAARRGARPCAGSPAPAPTPAPARLVLARSPVFSHNTRFAVLLGAGRQH